MPSKLDEITQSMFETVGRKMKFPLNVIFTNIWLFRVRNFGRYAFLVQLL